GVRCVCATGHVRHGGRFAAPVEDVAALERACPAKARPAGRARAPASRVRHRAWRIARAVDDLVRLTNPFHGADDVAPSGCARLRSPTFRTAGHPVAMVDPPTPVDDVVARRRAPCRNARGTLAATRMRRRRWETARTAAHVTTPDAGLTRRPVGRGGSVLAVDDVDAAG